jgi:hypothetical protein
LPVIRAKQEAIKAAEKAETERVLAEIKAKYNDLGPLPEPIVAETTQDAHGPQAEPIRPPMDEPANQGHSVGKMFNE